MEAFQVIVLLLILGVNEILRVQIVHKSQIIGNSAKSSIVNDVRKEFFSFHSFQLVNLLDEYELKYGNKAAEYARETMPKWKSGQTKMSGQTAERLLNLVPRYLTYDSRFHMVQKLCNHHAPKIDRTVSINPENINAGLAEVEDHLNNLLSGLPTIKWLPDYVSETVKWLNMA